MKLESTVLDKYLYEITKDEFHRYRSWDNCFKYFSENKKTENHCLQLGFYLASWGMYRGSSGLLQKNHLIHDKAISIIFKSKYDRLRCNKEQEVDEKTILLLLELKNEMADYYSALQFLRQSEKLKISATDTLLSKILLGTIGCVPAFDRYFILGLKEEGIKFSRFDENSLKQLFAFAVHSKDEIQEFQNKVYKKLRLYYPVMKILDMYFWQIGYDKEIEKRRNAKC